MKVKKIKSLLEARKILARGGKIYCEAIPDSTMDDYYNTVNTRDRAIRVPNVRLDTSKTITWNSFLSWIRSTQAYKQNAYVALFDDAQSPGLNSRINYQAYDVKYDPEYENVQLYIAEQGDEKLLDSNFDGTTQQFYDHIADIVRINGCGNKSVYVNDMTNDYDCEICDGYDGPAALNHLSQSMDVDDALMIGVRSIR